MKSDEKFGIRLVIWKKRGNCRLTAQNWRINSFLHQLWLTPEVPSFSPPATALSRAPRGTFRRTERRVGNHNTRTLALLCRTFTFPYIFQRSPCFLPRYVVSQKQLFWGPARLLLKAYGLFSNKEISKDNFFSSVNFPITSTEKRHLRSFSTH